MPRRPNSKPTTRTCPHCGKVSGIGQIGTHIRYAHETKPEDLFWAKVDKRGPAECWLWTGARRWDGYGRFNIKAKAYTAHRFSWRLVHGEIPDGMHVLHSCDTPACVNPAHLRIGTHDENMAEMLMKGRHRNGPWPDSIRNLARK